MVTITKSEIDYKISLEDTGSSKMSKVITGTIKMRLLIWKRYPVFNTVIINKMNYVEYGFKKLNIQVSHQI